jgi:Tfp pilus assembly protein PilF
MMRLQGRLWTLLWIAWVVSGLFACAGQQTERNQELAGATREIGEAYMRQGDFTSALRELLKAEQLDPDDHFVHNDLGLAYMAKKMMPEAISHFKKAIEIKPSYTPARNNLGNAYLAVEEWDLAIATFKEITKDALYATPQYPLSNLGFAYYNKKDYNAALNYYREALKLQPDMVQALVGSGRAYLALKQGRQALRALEKAVKLSPKAPEIHFYLAEAYLANGQTPQARASYETVIDLAPSESDLALKAKQRLGRR